MSAETDTILATFLDLLRGPTGDGAHKRATAGKPLWTVDTTHEAAMYRHLKRWEEGELADKDSKAHPLVHVAWRALALAFQEVRAARPHSAHTHFEVKAP